MGDRASERGLGGFARLGSELGSSADHSCLSAAPCWLLAGTAGTRGRGLRGSHLPRGQARSEKSCPPPRPVRPHGRSPCPRKGRDKGQTDVHFSSALRRWTPWSLVLFCILNGLEVTGKLGLLKMPGEFSLENDALKAEAPYFKAVLTYQGCLLSITMNQAWQWWGWGQGGRDGLQQ